MNVILKNDKPGKLITVEGVDTAGKSTQVELLARDLFEKGKEVEVYHFPMYERPIGNLIGQLLNVKSDTYKVNLEAMQMLYVADQLDFQRELNEKLADGINVILDRYDLSTIVYYATRTSMAESMSVVYKKWQTQLLKPDLTFILNLPPREIAKRKGTLDLFERDLDFMTKVSFGYETLARMLTDRQIVSLDAKEDIKTIHEKIIGKVMSLWET
jgi:dTMP kinase